MNAETAINDEDETGRTRCEIWQRVMGYCRPVSSWNKGKQQEFKDRKYFVLKECDFQDANT